MAVVPVFAGVVVPLVAAGGLATFGARRVFAAGLAVAVAVTSATAAPAAAALAALMAGTVARG